MRRDRYDYPSPQEPALPLGRRLARFCALLAALFAITAAIIVTQRLSRDSLALLIGLSCGVMAMLPTLALGLLIWRREDARRAELAQRQPAPYPSQPPVIVVTPQALPGYGDPRALSNAESGPWQWASARSERKFEIVGGED